MAVAEASESRHQLGWNAISSRQLRMQLSTGEQPVEQSSPEQIWHEQLASLGPQSSALELH